MQENSAAKLASGQDSSAMLVQLRELVRVHHGNLLKQIDKLGDMLSRIDASEAKDATLVRDAEALAHQIKGAGGSIGFLDVSRAATTLDDDLKGLVKQSSTVSPDQVRKTLGLFRDLQAIAKSTTPESSTLYNANLSPR